MDILRIAAILVIVALSYIVSAIACVVRVISVALLDVHLFMEWCMGKLVDLVDKIDPPNQ